MAISTKKGDTGRTSLADGTEVGKDAPHIEALGTLDELICWLGCIKHSLPAPDLSRITDLQRTLIRLSGEVAFSGKNSRSSILETDVEGLETLIVDYEKRFNVKKFVIPGTSKASAEIDICRTIARRAERRLVAIPGLLAVSPLIFKFINRLSDLLFLIAHAPAAPAPAAPQA